MTSENKNVIPDAAEDVQASVDDVMKKFDAFEIQVLLSGLTQQQEQLVGLSLLITPDKDHTDQRHTDDDDNDHAHHQQCHLCSYRSHGHRLP